MERAMHDGDGKTDASSPTSSSLTRRAFVGASVVGAIAIAERANAAPARLATLGAPGTRQADAATRAVEPFELEEATIADLQAGMASGKYTARSITQLYLDRIAALDQKGPTLNAVLELNPDALAIADQLDAERKAGKVRGPMHGIPVLIKDNIDTADKMHTSAGSLALANNTAKMDSHVAHMLRGAGAIILGKTNLSEWANFRSSNASSGWSGRGGQTLNPYATDRTPSGSSSGSGTASASSYCAVAVGTETDGSVTSPSAVAGLVGIKPTVGLVSRAGIIPISHSQDTAGPMTRSVRDAAILLGAMTGIDERDAATAKSKGKSYTDYTQFLDANGLKGARIGVVRKHVTGYNPSVDQLFENALEAMKGAGATIVDGAEIPTAGKFGDDEFEVLLYEFKDDLNKYLANVGPGMPHSLAELIAFDDATASREMPYFGQDIFISAQKKGPLTEAKYRKAAADARRLAGKEGIDAALKKHRVDVLVAPTQGPATRIDLVNGDTGAGGSFTTPAAVAGYPHLTVNMGQVHGLPVGLSFVGTAWSEPTLLKLAYAYEQATKMRKPPTFASSAAVSYARP